MLAQVTYRLLSRLVPCHVDLAKQHLYAFYTSPAAKQANVHATYLVAGTSTTKNPTLRNGQVNGDGPGHESMELDEASPEATQSDEQVTVIRDEEVQETRIEVVDQEDLEGSSSIICSI